MRSAVLRTRVLTLSCAASLLVGCLGRDRRSRGDDDDDGAPGAGPVDEGPSVDDPVDPAPGQDPPPPDDAAPADPDPPADPRPIDERGPYPAGPYGVWDGDTLGNYAFLTGSGTLTMQDVRQDRAHDILLLYLGSASCAYCGVESPELNTLYAADESRGLEILGILSDEGGGPPTGASADRYFRDDHDAEYPYGANEWVDGTLMTDLYPDGNVALPMNFIIDLETMEILMRMDGYPSEGGLAPLVEPYLGG